MTDAWIFTIANLFIFIFHVGFHHWSMNKQSEIRKDVFDTILRAYRNMGVETSDQDHSFENFVWSDLVDDYFSASIIGGTTVVRVSRKHTQQAQVDALEYALSKIKPSQYRVNASVNRGDEDV